MLVGSRPYRVATHTRRELIVLFVTGVCLALLLLGLSVVYVGYQGAWYRIVHQKTVVNDPLGTFKAFMVAFDAETEARVKDLDTLPAAVKATDDALAEFVEDMEMDNGFAVTDLQNLFAAYREDETGTAGMGPLLTHHLSVVHEACAILLSLIYDTLSPRPRSAVNTLVTEATLSAAASVASRTQFLHGTRSRLTDADSDTILPVEAASLAVRVSMAESFQRFAREIDEKNVAISQATLLGELIDPARDLLAKGTKFLPPGTVASYVTMPTAIESVKGLRAFLATRERLVSAKVLEDLRALILIAVGAGLALLALAAVTWVLLRYRREIGPTRRLAAAFEDRSHHRRLQLQYLPLLQDLRAVSLPTSQESADTTEVEREYLIAARAVDALRVAVPQLLMSSVQFSPTTSTVVGTSSTMESVNSANNVAKVDGGAFALSSLGSSAKEQDRGDVGRNNLLNHAARLELGSTLCRNVVVLEFGVFLARADSTHTQECLEEDFVVLSKLYQVVVEEVNLAGGVVLGFHEGVNILCAWNVDQGDDGLTKEEDHTRASDAVAAAIRASWIVRYRLQKEERLINDPQDDFDALSTRPLTHVCASVVSGSAVLSNDALVGDRRFASLQGGLLGNLAKMRAVGRTAATSTLLDGPTQKRLSTSWQRQSCKPLVVLKSASGSGTFTVYSASEEDGNMTADQAVLYNAGFVLYQNNMIKEAVNEFKRYLSLYNDDRRALWLMNQVLLPKQCSLDAH